MTDVAARFDLPPTKAIEFFRRKGLRSSFAWQDVWAAEHEASFTVAKMGDIDLLTTVRDAVDRALAEGTTQAQFNKQLIPTLQKEGWWGVQEQVDPLTGKDRLVQLGSPRRLQTIFRTNLQTAYAAGEWADILDTAEVAPYLMYDAVDDTQTRPAHHSWDGTVLRITDEWWRTHRPPNGWNCRCSVIQLGDADLQSMGREIDQAPRIERREYVNKRTGEVMQIPKGIDPGWDYNPGAGRQEHLESVLRIKRHELKQERD